MYAYHGMSQPEEPPLMGRSLLLHASHRCGHDSSSPIAIYVYTVMGGLQCCDHLESMPWGSVRWYAQQAASMCMCMSPWARGGWWCTVPNLYTLSVSVMQACLILTHTCVVGTCSCIVVTVAPSFSPFLVWSQMLWRRPFLMPSKYLRAKNVVSGIATWPTRMNKSKVSEGVSRGTARAQSVEAGTGKQGCEAGLWCTLSTAYVHIPHSPLCTLRMYMFSSQSPIFSLPLPPSHQMMTCFRSQESTPVRWCFWKWRMMTEPGPERQSDLMWRRLWYYTFMYMHSCVYT